LQIKHAMREARVHAQASVQQGLPRIDTKITHRQVPGIDAQHKPR